METTGNIVTIKIGQNEFTFNVGTRFTNTGTKRYVFVKQETIWNEEDLEIFGFEMPNLVINRKFYYDLTTSEFGAINLAGNKLINNWKNIR